MSKIVTRPPMLLTPISFSAAAPLPSGPLTSASPRHAPVPPASSQRKSEKRRSRQASSGPKRRPDHFVPPSNDTLPGITSSSMAQQQPPHQLAPLAPLTARTHAEQPGATTPRLNKQPGRTSSLIQPLTALSAASVTDNMVKLVPAEETVTFALPTAVAEQSEIIKQMLQNGAFRESIERRITFPMIRSQVLRAVCKYLLILSEGSEDKLAAFSPTVALTSLPPAQSFQQSSKLAGASNGQPANSARTEVKVAPAPAKPIQSSLEETKTAPSARRNTNFNSSSAVYVSPLLSMPVASGSASSQSSTLSSAPAPSATTVASTLPPSLSQPSLVDLLVELQSAAHFLELNDLFDRTTNSLAARFADISIGALRQLTDEALQAILVRIVTGAATIPPPHLPHRHADGSISKPMTHPSTLSHTTTPNPAYRYAAGVMDVFESAFVLLRTELMLMFERRRLDTQPFWIALYRRHRIASPLSFPPLTVPLPSNIASLAGKISTTHGKDVAELQRQYELVLALGLTAAHKGAEAFYLTYSPNQQQGAASAQQQQQQQKAISADSFSSPFFSAIAATQSALSPQLAITSTAACMHCAVLFETATGALSAASHSTIAVDSTCDEHRTRVLQVYLDRHVARYVPPASAGTAVPSSNPLFSAALATLATPATQPSVFGIGTAPLAPLTSVAALGQSAAAAASAAQLSGFMEIFAAIAPQVDRLTIRNNLLDERLLATLIPTFRFSPLASDTTASSSASLGPPSMDKIGARSNFFAVRALDVSNASFSRAQLAAIAHALRALAPVTALDLRECSLTADGLRALWTGLLPTAREEKDKEKEKLEKEQRDKERAEREKIAAATGILASRSTPPLPSPRDGSPSSAMLAVHPFAAVSTGNGNHMNAAVPLLPALNPRSVLTYQNPQQQAQQQREASNNTPTRGLTPQPPQSGTQQRRRPSFHLPLSSIVAQQPTPIRAVQSARSNSVSTATNNSGSLTARSASSSSINRNLVPMPPASPISPASPLAGLRAHQLGAISEALEGRYGALPSSSSSAFTSVSSTASEKKSSARSAHLNLKDIKEQSDVPEEPVRQIDELDDKWTSTSNNNDETLFLSLRQNANFSDVSLCGLLSKTLNYTGAGSVLRMLDVSSNIGIGSTPLASAGDEMPLSGQSTTSTASGGAQLLAELLQRHKSLTSLRCARCNFGGRGIQMIIEAAITSKSLTALDVSSNVSSASEGLGIGSTIATLLGNSTTLTSLNVAQNLVSTSGIVAMSAALAENTIIHTLDVSGIDMSGTYVSNGNVADDASHGSNAIPNNLLAINVGVAFSQAVSMNASLQSLNLSETRLTEKALLTLAEAIGAPFNSLTSLNISGNTFSSEAAAYFGKTLGAHRSLTSFVAKAPQQEGIMLMCAEGAAAFARAFIVAATAASITGATSSAIPPSSASLSATAARSPLQHLDLSGQCVRNSGMLALFALTQHANLRHFVLRGNLINERGAVALSAQLAAVHQQHLAHSNTMFRTALLDLRDNKIGLAGIRALQAANSECLLPTASAMTSTSSTPGAVSQSQQQQNQNQHPLRARFQFLFDG